MSFLDRPAMTGWQMLGCAVYLIAVFVVVFMAMTIVVFDGWDQPPMPGWKRFLIFPGSAIAAVIGGALLLKFFMRDRN